MTLAIELFNKLNREYGLNKWPTTYEVDAATYGSCCQAVFNLTGRIMLAGVVPITINIGPKGGLMFKNVELLLKS